MPLHTVFLSISRVATAFRHVTPRGDESLRLLAVAVKLTRRVEEKVALKVTENLVLRVAVKPSLTMAAKVAAKSFACTKKWQYKTHLK